jgi:riboflavin kinase, archaea type
MTDIVADVIALKHIALRGAINGFVEVSSSELGGLLGVSQQTASRRIRDLEKLGFVRREMGVHRQLIRLTETGVSRLRDELGDYQRIFALKDRLTVAGVVASGLGEGAYYLSQQGYVRQFEAKLGFSPYAGTLNLEIQGAELGKIRILKSSRPIQIEGFEDQGRTFGGVDAWRAKLDGYACAAILPRRTHHTRTLELIAPDRLRDKFQLKDGDTLRVVISLSDAP